MTVYILSFILCFALMPSIWHSGILIISGFFLSPKAEKTRFFFSLILGLILFFVFLSENKVNENTVETDSLSGFAYSIDDRKVELYTSNFIEKPILLYLKNSLDLKGEKILVKEPKPFKQKTKNLHDFIFLDYIKSRGYASSYFAKDYTIIKNVEEKDNIFRRFIGALRLNMWNKTKFLKKKSKDLYSALIMGSLPKKSSLGNLAMNHGIIHLFVVSGFHFSIVFFGIKTFFLFITDKKYNIAILFALLSISLYYAVLGGGFGSTRAYISIIISTLCFLTGRTYSGEDVLFSLALFWILAYPDSVTQIGFILSFISTYTVILISKSEIIKKIELFYLKMIFISLLSGVLIISFISVLGSELPLFSFLNVVISSALFSFFIPIMFVFSLIPESFEGVLNIFSKIINTISNIYINFLSSIENISLIKIFIPQKLSIIIVSLILLMFISRKLYSLGWNKKRIILMALILIIIFLPVFVSEAELELITFDLKDGEAYLIKTKSHTMVYDVGNDEAFINLLKSEGVKSIDLLVISHADQDHYGMINQVYENFDIKKLVVDVGEKEINLGDLKVEFYKSYDIFGSRNDQSVVCKLIFDSTEILLTGDIQAMGIRDILKIDLEKVDILKAPHHGSFTENLSELISACSPEMVLISGGRGKKINKKNIYEELNKVNMPFYDTIRDGEIRLRYKDGKWKTSTMLNNR